MAKKLRAPKLPSDPRWPEFVRKYAFDLNRFAFEVCGQRSTWQQVDLFNSVQDEGSRTSVASGHGTGKSRSLGIIAIWHLLCFYYSNTLITAPKIEQVRNVAWKEIADIKDYISNGSEAWIAELFTVEAERVYVKGFKDQWFVIAKTAPRGSPENLAGMHRDWYMVIADEASGIPDANYGVLTGGLTDKRNRMLMTSQPTRNTGYFYDSHHGQSKSRGGPWNSLTFNSEESPLVSMEWIHQKRNEYGGISDPQYQIKVRGVFPENLVGQLLSRSTLEATIGIPSIIPAGAAYGNVLLVDVGAGEYRDKTVVIAAKVFGNGQPHEDDARKVHIYDIPICSNTISETTLLGELMQIAGKLSNVTIMVDGGGIGGPFIKRLQELGQSGVIKVLWGNFCFKKALKEVFFNQRAQAMVTVARAVKAGHLSIAPTAFRDSRNQTEMLDQGSRIPYHFNDKAQYVIESKRSKEWEGLPSPDIWDAISFAFLEDCQYISTDAPDDVERPASMRDEAIKRMEAMLEAQLNGGAAAEPQTV
jgi:hypothetical protein